MLLPLFDPPRHDTKETIEKCIEKGISVKMVTGDQLLIGKETAKQLGMGTNMYTTEVIMAVRTCLPLTPPLVRDKLRHVCMRLHVRAATRISAEELGAFGAFEASCRRRKCMLSRHTQATSPLARCLILHVQMKEGEEDLPSTK